MKSIVIHRGGPYGGHYHAYIKDELGDGNWDLKLPEIFAKEPTEVDDRPADVKKKEEEALAKAIEESKKEEKDDDTKKAVEEKKEEVKEEVEEEEQ